MERLYTCEEIASAAGLCVQTVQRLCRDGSIRAVKFGSVWRIPESAIFGDEGEKEAAPHGQDGRRSKDSVIESKGIVAHPCADRRKA
jgi:excisionase family DNA binding protein